MNKVELVNAVVEKMANDGVKVTKKDMASYVDAVVNTIKDAMLAGDEVSLTGFGKFSVVERSARVGVNPQNPSQKIEIAATKAPKMKFSGTFRDQIKSA